MTEHHVTADVLRDCLERAARAPFYGARLASDGTVNTSTFATLPLTTKHDLQRHGANAFLAAPTSSWLQYHESFGTTGRPAGSWFSGTDYARDGDRVRHWAAPFAKQRVLIRFPYALSMPAHLAQRAAMRVGACVIGASSRDTVCTHARAVRLVDSLGVSALACSPFEALLLAEAAALLGCGVASVRALCVAGELLSDGYRGLLEDTWSAPVWNLYGSTETGALATSCDAGHLHTCDGQLIEVVDEHDPSRSAPHGTIGRLVVTTLDREAMPLVRYDTGDLASWPRRNECTCARTTPVLELHGRTKTGHGHTERQLQDLACGVARAAGARFVRAVVEPAGLRVDVEALPAGEQATVRDGLPLRVRRVPTGTLVDRALLIAEPSATKPRLVTVEGADAPHNLNGATR